jgi:hypothetical protein
MSISRSSEKLPEVRKDKFYKDRHFKKMFVDTIKNISHHWNVFQISLVILLLISGIGELFGAKFSWFWYVIVFIDLIYTIIKDIFMKEAIEYKEEGGIPKPEIKK